ncbi:hypothetical protein V8C42DRAFT_330926 [Trichoderma barbatum]
MPLSRLVVTFACLVWGLPLRRTDGLADGWRRFSGFPFVSVLLVMGWLDQVTLHCVVCPAYEYQCVVLRNRGQRQV